MKLSTIIISVALAAIAFAHGGFEHVMGTVVKSEKNVLTVKTDKGNVDVKLDAKTAITKGDSKAMASDLMPGLRVVVDLPEKVKNPVAVSVKIGVAAAVEAHGHDEHK